MSVGNLVTRGQALAESLMLDTFTPYIPFGKLTDASGMKQPTDLPQTPHAGKLQGGSQQSSDTSTRTFDVAGVAHYVITGGLHIPVSAPAPVAGAVGTGWEYELTVAGPNTPPELVGSRWLVVDSPSKSHMTARRLDVVRLA